MTEATSITPGELTIAGPENPLTPEQQRAAVALDIASQALYPPTVFGGRGAGLTPDVNAILGAAQFVLDGDVAIDDIETHTGAPGSPLPFQIIEALVAQGSDSPRTRTLVRMPGVPKGHAWGSENDGSADGWFAIDWETYSDRWHLVADDDIKTWHLVMQGVARS